jgi:hypothetical protein
MHRNSTSWLRRRIGSAACTRSSRYAYSCGTRCAQKQPSVPRVPPIFAVGTAGRSCQSTRLWPPRSGREAIEERNNISARQLSSSRRCTPSARPNCGLPADAYPATWFMHELLDKACEDACHIPLRSKEDCGRHRQGGVPGLGPAPDRSLDGLPGRRTASTKALALWVP